MLLAREQTTAVDAVARLVALQAQAARPPFVGLWTRIEGFRRADLLEPLRRRQIVRGTALRATLHVMTADDFVNLRGGLQPALTAAMHGVLGDRSAGLDAAALEAIARRFFGEAPATFDRLRIHLKTKHPKADERAMAYAIRTHVPLVQVPTDAPWGFRAPAEFTMADAWLGRKIPTEPAPALLLARRYLAAFGPATPADAQVWSGVPGIREAFEALRPELVTFRDARNRELFDLPDAPRPDAGAQPPVRFLPEFDNLLLSYRDRTRILADAHRSRVFSKNLLVRATFLVNGFVAGAWKIERKGKRALLVLEPFGPLARKTMRALEREGEALARFVEDEAASHDVRWSS